MRVKLLLISIFSMVLMASNSFAYCIYNHTDLWLEVTTPCGYKYLSLGDKFCADWKNKECNQEGKENSLIYIMVYYRDFNYGSEVRWSPLFLDIKIKANQDLEIYQTTHTGQLHKDYHWRTF